MNKEDLSSTSKAPVLNIIHSNYSIAGMSNDFTDADPRVLERFILVSVPKSKSGPVKRK